MTETQLCRKFDLYGALYIFCTRWHSGQWSRGYRILSLLSKRGYKPGLSMQHGLFETPEQEEIYKTLVDKYAFKM